MPSIPLIIGVVASAKTGGGGGGGQVNGYQTTVMSTADSNTQNFPGIAIGSEFAERRVVVAVHWGGPSATPTTIACTIGGVTASLDADSNVQSNKRVVLMSAVVPTGTTADVNITFSGGTQPAGRCGVGVWVLDNMAPSGQSDSQITSEDATLNVTTVVGDFVIAAGYFTKSSGTVSTAWSGAAERYDQAIENSWDTITAADIEAVGTLTSITHNSDGTIGHVSCAAGYR